MYSIGIDPGLAITGWAVLASGERSATVCAMGAILTSSSARLPERLGRIHQEVSALLARFVPSELAIEQFFFMKRAQSVLSLGHARGVILLAATQHGVPVFEYNPRSVKIALTGFGSADKAQMQQMVKRLLFLEGIPEPDDVADACAISLCHMQERAFAKKVGVR